MIDTPAMSGSSELPTSARKARRTCIDLVVAMSVAGFFIFFTASAMHVRFVPDDLMNTYYYWARGGSKVVLANVMFWSPFTRPMAALYYLLLFKIFGFNPFPYNAVRLAILSFDAFLFFMLAARISGSRPIAAAATVPVAYHAGLAHLAYQGPFIYDVLCGGFYFFALLYYIRHVSAHGRLSLRQSCVFLALYIGALNSKEMAVSLPVVVFAYQLLFGEPETWDVAGIRRRLTANAGPLLAAIAITVVFIIGKTSGPEAMTQMWAYRPVYTWARFAESNTRFLNTIFYTNEFTAKRVILIWTALLCVAVIHRDRRLTLLGIWVIVTPLPLAFLPQALAQLITRTVFCSRISSRAALTSVLVIGVGLYGHETSRRHQGIEEACLHSGDQTWSLIQQFRAFPVRPAPRSRIVFLNDPFPNLPNAWCTVFAAALSWNDRSLTIWLQNQAHFPKNELSRMNYVFDFSDGMIRQVGP